MRARGLGSGSALVDRLRVDHNGFRHVVALESRSITVSEYHRYLSLCGRCLEVKSQQGSNQVGGKSRHTMNCIGS